MSWFFNRSRNRAQRIDELSYELRPAQDFLFERRSLNHGRTGGSGPHESGSIVVSGNRPPCRVTHREEHIIRKGEASVLTITSDPGNSIVVVGGRSRDWSVFFRTEGFGQSEVEAAAKARLRSLAITGRTVALTAPELFDRGHDATAELVVEAPADSGVVMHGMCAPAEVRDMSGPVRIAAVHARATILDTTGRVDVTAGCVDFAGACGQVSLTAELEINLKMRGSSFDGRLAAWAQRSVRLLIPRDFWTPVQVTVSSRDRFVCRAGICSKMEHTRQGELHLFAGGMDNADPDRFCLRLRSESSTVVIDRCPPA